jgi:hypothetical protein
LQQTLPTFIRSWGGACWYDDYAWWGIASCKSYDSAYNHIFDAQLPFFQSLTQTTWDTLNNGIKGTLKRGAPNVWNNCDQAYFTQPATWAKPRVENGVWQYEIFHEERKGDCSYYNPSDPVSPPKDPNKVCTLGPFQDTVVNALYLLLAARLRALGVAADPEPRAAAEREFNFLASWFFMPDPTVSPGLHSLIWDLGDDTSLFRERVSTYAELIEAPGWELKYPEVRAYYPDAVWCGDQGLMLNGIVEHEKLRPSGFIGVAIRTMKGVSSHLTKNGVVQATTESWPIGDVGDYSCGSGVFMRCLLHAFKSNDQMNFAVLSTVQESPDANFIYKSAEDACNTDPNRSEDPDTRLFDHFNVLATLTAAIEILGKAD